MKRDKSEKRVWELPLQKAFCVPPQQPLLTLMKKFQEGRSHLAIVSSDPDADVPLSDEPCPTKVLGVVTIEDVIEEIIQEEIYDEKDKSYIDQQQINPRLMASASEDEPLVPHEVRRCRSLNESDLNISYRSQLRGFAAKGRKRGSDKYRAAIIGEEQSRYGSVASPSIV